MVAGSMNDNVQRTNLDALSTLRCRRVERRARNLLTHLMTWITFLEDGSTITRSSFTTA